MPTGSHETTENASDTTTTPASPHAKRNAVLRGVALIGVVIAWLAIAGLGGPAIDSGLSLIHI